MALAKLTQRDGQESTEKMPVWNETSWSLEGYGELSVIHNLVSITKYWL